jgi:hypothetical protein
MAVGWGADPRVKIAQALAGMKKKAEWMILSALLFCLSLSLFKQHFDDWWPDQQDRQRKQLNADKWQEAFEDVR